MASLAPLLCRLVCDRQEVQLQEEITGVNRSLAELREVRKFKQAEMFCAERGRYTPECHNMILSYRVRRNNTFIDPEPVNNSFV